MRRPVTFLGLYHGSTSSITPLHILFVQQEGFEVVINALLLIVGGRRRKVGYIGRVKYELELCTF